MGGGNLGNARKKEGGLPLGAINLIQISRNFSEAISEAFGIVADRWT